MKKDALISVAAGSSQAALFDAAEKLGLEVIAIDRDPDAVGFGRSALSVVASTHDAEQAFDALTHALERAPELRPVAVATKSSGPPVATAAEIAARLGLAGIAPRRARSLVSKPGQLKYAAFTGVRVPRHCAPPSLEELANTGMVPPFVVKPATTVVGKRAIALVETLDELPKRFDAARAASQDGRCEIEAFLPGQDLVIAALFRDSKVISTLELDEDTRFTPDGSLRGFGLSLPSRFAGRGAARDARASVGRFIAGLELGTGFGLWTFRVTEDGEPALLEVHLDLAGDLVTDVLLPRALGVDPIVLVLRNLLGRPAEFPAFENATALRFVFADELDRACSLGEAEWRSLGVAPGAAVLPRQALAGDPGGGSGGDEGEDQGGGSRSGHVLLTGRDAEELERAVARLDVLLGR